MQKMNLPGLFELCAEIMRIKHNFSEENKASLNIPPEIIENNVRIMENHHSHFEELSMHMCRLQCINIKNILEGKNVTTGMYAESLNILLGRMYDEAKLTYGFMLTPAEMELYEQQSPLFGKVVSKYFPSASDDIVESGKCLALGRGTACVMHLMRVMEVGLKALARPLGIPYAPSWEAYLSQISKQIATPHKQKSRIWRKREAFFRDVSGDLIAIKQAWRNPSMHVVRKYSNDEADDILRAVRRFMCRLADHLPENGGKKISG